MMVRSTEHTRRPGVTLVELVAVMVAGSVLMGVTISALASIQHADRRLKEVGSERRAFERLADQMRRDIHAADRVSWDSDAERLALTMPAGDLTTYEHRSDRWERRVSESPNEESQLAGAYRAPKGVQFAMSPAVAEKGSQVSLTWTSTARLHDPRRTTPPPEEMVVIVGRDLALLHE